MAVCILFALLCENFYQIHFYIVMIENLVIVESPAKARTIEKFLGKEFNVQSSFGHIRDLAKKNLGIEIDNKFQPQYIVSEDKKKVVSELKKYAKEAKIVWLASDASSRNWPYLVPWSRSYRTSSYCSGDIVCS